VQILSKGASGALPHLSSLRAKIVERHELFVRLCPSAVKPKLHHLLYLPSDIAKVGASLSCFAMERKHRVVKAASLSVFRHFEHTVLVDVAHAQLASLLSPRYTSRPCC